MNPTFSQRLQQNCASVGLNDFNNRIIQHENNYKNHNSSSTDSLYSSLKVDSAIIRPTTRRFTRKQLLSRPVNRKEKLLYCNNNNNAVTPNKLASTAYTPPPPPPRARGVAEYSSCAATNARGLLSVTSDTATPATVAEHAAERGSITKVYVDHPSTNDDIKSAIETDEEKDEDKRGDGESSSCGKPSPASSALSIQKDDDQDSTNNKIIDIKSVHFSSDLDEISRGIQVTPPQFRLRFIPHIKWTCTARGLCLIVLRVFASQLGLAIFLLVWTMLGAAAFHATEGEREAHVVHELRLLEGRLAMDLSTELRQAPPDHRSVWWRTLEHGIRRQENALAEALSSGYAPNGGIIWNYAGSLLFAVTMLTTIGFGAPVPRTPLGRTSAVIYSAVSIPLHLLLVVNFGALVADKLELCLQRIRRRRRQRCNLGDFGDEIQRLPFWFSWLPVFAIISYYLFGMALFGGAPLFPLEFTTAGGVGQRSSTLRTVYAVYLECAVVLAGISVNVWRNTASSGFIRLGLKLDLLARGRNYA